MIEDSLRDQVLAWIEDDPDSATKAELSALLERGERDELADRFQGPLTFGTAGLRGLLGGGPHRMNRAVVIRATAGLCAYLRRVVPDVSSRGVVIGFDGRRMSRELARDAAEVVLGAGITARYYEDVAPTPLVGFTVLESGAAAGIVITASHNPPAYNGYKVYWGNGAQIIPPHDAAIAGEIARVASVTRVPRPAREGHPLSVRLGDDMRRRYLDGVQRVLLHPGKSRDFTIAYTAMHGVGGAMLLTALREAGFERVFPVPEQQEPDGTFPTVSFPNPEEKGAMDMVLAVAERAGAELVLANDPDADRLAVSVLHKGQYVPLSGNDIGCLLAHYLLEQGPQDEKRAVVCSVVSSPMLLAIGAAHGAVAEQTLTGHKWIQNRGIELESEGLRFVFGYEEALGYGVGTLVRDKDGISAAVLMADMAAWCRSQGRTLIDERERAWRKYGMYLSEQISIVLPGADGRRQIEALMQRARTEAPSQLDGLAVVAVQDVLAGTRREQSGHIARLALPSEDVVVYELEGGHRAMLRPSGTEPKLKLYFDLRVDVGRGETIADAEARGRSLVTRVVEDFRAKIG